MAQSLTIPLPEAVWYQGEELELSLGFEASALSLLHFVFEGRVLKFSLSQFHYLL